ncbi:hypothetical protein HDV57DRAFT_39055 [Trichoderma longibrachiatum]|uniref:Uncharacterized protein n=1 Tax=Trichoderma longibrachiatum ATCC 18648 TaxID=983965 RepID=A0A2T4CHH6_TRILO|nr:hypothetical protein M440DRAFT_1005629 [Trichoderma longibrachiatum ATCC 18648]
MGIVNNGVQAAKARRKDNPRVPPHFLITMIDQPLHQQINSPLLVVSGTSVRQTKKTPRKRNQAGTEQWAVMQQVDGRQLMEFESRFAGDVAKRPVTSADSTDTEIHNDRTKARLRELSELPKPLSSELRINEQMASSLLSAYRRWIGDGFDGE